MIRYNIYTERYHRQIAKWERKKIDFPTDPDKIAMELQTDGTLCPRLEESYTNPITALNVFRKYWKDYGKTLIGEYDAIIEFSYLAIEYDNPDDDRHGWDFGWLDWGIQNPEATPKDTNPDDLPTYTEIKKNPKYKLHHSSWGRGYVSRKLTESEFPVEPYKGKFGKGYKVKKPNWNSSNYCVIEYWIEK